jgi:glutamine---fructose-6-phosphate transaminase (isomerizing)
VSSLDLEVRQQPDSLRHLIQFYGQAGADVLAGIPCPARPVFTGMGASFHAAMIAAFHMQKMGVSALAIEASDILHYGKSFLSEDWDIVYISQSGSSAEVGPILALLGTKKIYLAITNNPQSSLNHSALFKLPLVVDRETLVASKTYTNSLAVLWLLVRSWSSSTDNHEFDRLLKIASRVEQTLQNSTSVSLGWLKELGDCRSLIFTGFGPHAATARQSAQTVSEWAKIPAWGMGAGALRHGFIEIADSENGFVVFAPPGVTYTNALGLAEELSGYKAHVLVVENGESRPVDERRSVDLNMDEFLSPFVDLIPVQLFADTLAIHLGITPGFRHLQKVITKI